MKNPIIIAETDRLILRKYRGSDLQDLHEYLSDPVVVKYEPYRPMSLDEAADSLAWRISTDEMIAVELKHSGKMIGNVYLGKRDFDSFEIGYVFNRSHWGKGYAKEACDALILMEFANGAHRIYTPLERSHHSWESMSKGEHNERTDFNGQSPAAGQHSRAVQALYGRTERKWS